MKKNLLISIVGLLLLGAINIMAQDQGTLINIDYPSLNQEVTDSLRIQGWYMTTSENTYMKAYIDETEVEVERKEREDVLRIIKGYGDISTNPTPGYLKYEDISGYSYGNHTFTVKVFNQQNEEIKRASTTFKKTQPKTLINIDYPTIEQEVTDSLRIQGWYMTTAKNTTEEVFIDNQKVEVERKEREDVLRIIKGYGDINTNPTPGLYKILNISGYSYGKHTLKVNVKDKDGNIIKTETREFNKISPKTLINIDYPTTNQEVTDTLRIQGWYMTTAKDTYMKAYIDETEVEVERKEREDVLRIIKGYGDISTNPTPGYLKYEDITNYSYGKHTFTVKVFDSSDKLIKESSVEFKRKTSDTLINIDFPNASQKIINTLRVQGWYMTVAKDTYMKAYIDDNEIEVERKEREDVLKIIKGYGDISTNPTPGYLKYEDISEYSYGKHTFTVKVFDKVDQLIKESSVTFEKQKPLTDLCIDFPKESSKEKNSVKISGWYLSEIENLNLKIYIDDNEVTIDSFTKRDDIFKVLTWFKKDQNPNPGYVTNVDIKNLKYGKHTIKVQIVDNNNVVLNKRTTEFIKEKPKSLINIDFPDGTTKYNVFVKGWYTVEYENTKSEVYIDDVLLEDVENSKRPDVFKVYPSYEEYMTNSYPGYATHYNMQDYSDGNHKITVKIINTDNDDIIAAQSKTFRLKKYDGKIWLDFPSMANQNDNFNISGWEMSESANSIIKIYLDGVQLSNVDRYERPDVINAVTDYGDITVNATPGYSTSVDITHLAEGNHKIKIELYNYLNELIADYNKDILIFRNVYNGIDISSYQTVYSWQAVKDSGIEYVIARAAVRGYGTAGNLRKDEKFSSHIQGARSVGIKCGAYVYTQAITEIEASVEANTALQQVSAVGGKSVITLPIVYDVEFSSCEGRCGRADSLDRDTRTRIAKVYLDTIKAAGYTPMIYASTNFLNNQLNMDELSEYPVWVAHYGVDKPTYRGAYEIWQYTSSGSVPGIYGDVDLDYFYKKY